jgi:hypothetical protein
MGTARDDGGDKGVVYTGGRKRGLCSHGKILQPIVYFIRETPAPLFLQFKFRYNL